ncbi:hypothetical protein [Achromobacter phage Motura]|uniref:Uncharacterized protein n=1 Tax=Achromobacter phage Motura TaxID=2591403 RepID=A0A514CSL9_9CAUD|nr:hypothetical protein H1O15_gp341 [Achromobacter phage Motura]QDH83465.1 hypothetical protein [Achromobacter phage Motura]
MYEGKQLSKVPFDEVQLGDFVQSHATRNIGVITAKIPKERARLAEDGELIIKWESNRQSWAYHYHFDRVTYRGHK